MVDLKTATWDSGFHWGLLRALGNSRLVTFSFVWLLVVPIAAKLLAPFAGQHTLDFSHLGFGIDAPITVTIALPFSWQRFYLMSGLFVIGQAIYWIACPEIVKRYGSFGDYRKDHAGPAQLREFLWIAERRASKEMRIALLQMCGSAHGLQPLKPDDAFRIIDSNLQPMNRKHDHEGVQIRHNRVFTAVLKVEKYARKFWFWLSGAFFAAGILLFLWVVGEGGIEVWNTL